MPSIMEAFQRLLGRSPAHVASELDAHRNVTNGASAVLAVETLVCGRAAMHGRWLDMANGQDGFFGTASAPHVELTSPSARATLATASGLSMSGLRASALVDGAEGGGITDILTRAVQHHLPLVLQLAHSTGSGSQVHGHELYHQLADTGAVQLFATTVQDSVDLTLVGHRLAESTLVPVVVVQDGDETASSLQDVVLPTPKLATVFLGAPDEFVDCPSPAQRALFGNTRRRVPRWHDLDRPVLLGGDPGAAARGLAAAGQRAYFADHVHDQWTLVVAELERLTGRSVPALHAYRTDDAQMVLVCQGASVEVVSAVADHVRKQRGIRVGVVGVRRLRPFPALELASLLYGKKTVAILERLDSPVASDPPLTREVRTALDRALVGASIEQPEFRHDAARHNARRDARSHPLVVSGVYGLAGRALLAADLVRYCVDLHETPKPLCYLGTAFAPPHSAYPKRQTQLDRLKKAYPEAVDRGVVAPALDVRSPETLALRIYRVGGKASSELSSAAARLLEQVGGGSIRSRIDCSPTPWGEVGRDTLVHAPEKLFDPGGFVSPDLTVVTHEALPLLAVHDSWLDEIKRDSAILMERDAAPDSEQSEFERLVTSSAGSRGHEVYGVIREPSEGEADRRERLLGALFGVLTRKQELSTTLIRLTHAHQPADDQGTHPELAPFQAGFDGVSPSELDGTPRATPALTTNEIPEIVRRAAKAQGFDPEPAFSLADFYNQCGVLYRDGQTHELVADPRLAVAVVPSLSAALSSTAVANPMLPTFEASACTGCGKCWTVCPDSAIGAVAIEPRVLLESSMQLSKQQSEDSSALRPVVSKLALRIHANLREAQPAPETAHDLMQESFEYLAAKVPSERREAIARAFASTVQQMGKLPVVRTRAFYDDVERQAPNHGELLSIVVNPDACKGCGTCVAVCEPEALKPGVPSDTRTREARQRWRLWEKLPDTKGSTLARLRDDPEVGTLPALLLSRHCSLSMSGGDRAESGSGAKIVLRAAIAATEYEMQQRFQRALSEQQETRDRLAARIREILSAAVPSDDFQSLSQGLVGLSEDSNSFSALVTRLEQVVGQGHVDVNELQQLVDAGQRLADLSWRLSGGETGLGRARMTLVLSADSRTRELVTFPLNPFVSPVVADARDAADIARGLAEGHIRQTLEMVRNVRRANLVLENPRKARLAESSLTELGFEDLSREERTLCPPVLLVGASAAFTDRALERLLVSQHPVKVLLLADVGGELGRAKQLERDPLELLSFAGSGAYVAQTSLANPEHLARALLSGVRRDGTAIVQVHAPSPREDGFATDGVVRQSELALLTRAHPLFSFDSARPGVFSNRLEIGENPAHNQAWVSSEAGRRLTPAEFWLTEARFSHHFEALVDQAPGPMPLAAYLELPAPERAHKTPYVLGGSGRTRLSVSSPMLAVAERRLQAWRTLQELSGVTAFTERLRTEAEEATSNMHQAELDQLRRHFEQKIGTLRTEQREELVTTVRDRLLTLAGYAATRAEVGASQ